MKLGILALVVATQFVSAATINLLSSAAATANNTANPTINIVQHPAWVAPLPGSQWVSVDVTGNPGAPGYTVLPSGTVIYFSHLFNIAYGVLNATLTVRADDTTSVKVNGTEIYAAANPKRHGRSRCG